jgi:hypothetical protein
MDLKLEGKIIVLTGGAGTITKQIAIKLIEEGATPCILTDPYDDVESRKAVNDLLLKHRKIDGLVNNLFNQQKAEHYFSLPSLVRSSLKKSRGSFVNICSLNTGFGFVEDWTHEYRNAEFSVNNVMVPAEIPQREKSALIEAIASTVLFLCSENARSVRSQFIYLDSKTSVPQQVI